MLDPDAPASPPADLVGDALAGGAPQARWARWVGAMAAFPTEVTSFATTPRPEHPGDWDDLGEVVGPGATAALVRPIEDPEPEPPAGWHPVGGAIASQLVADRLAGSPALESAAQLVTLTSDDVPEMLALIDIARPGPFAERTIELGGYVGVRIGGELAAMAGRRLQPTGWAEISAVCTHPDHRGRGFGAVVTLAVAEAVREEGAQAFLHVSDRNPGARALYERLGFVEARRVRFTALAAPGAAPMPTHGIPDDH